MSKFFGPGLSEEQKQEYRKFMVLIAAFIAVILLVAALSPGLLGRGLPSLLGLKERNSDLPAVGEEFIRDKVEILPIIEQGNSVEPPVSHVVLEGQLLPEIARLYGIPLEDLAAANNLDAPYELAEGSVLIIPES